MKKLFALLTLVALLATLSLTAFADVAEPAFPTFTEEFETMPSGLENNSFVSLVGNTALNISIPGKAGDYPGADASTAVTPEWGYKGWIAISDEAITTDCTVSFWCRLEKAQDGFNNGFNLTLSDNIGKPEEGHNLASIRMDHTEFAKVSYMESCGSADPTYASAPDGCQMSAGRGKTGEWQRFDIQVDFTNGKAVYFMNCNKIGEGTLGSEITGFKGFKTSLVSSGNYRADWFVDELIVQNGICTPEADDVASIKDRDALKSDPAIVKYLPFDALNGSMSNTAVVTWKIVETAGFNQSLLDLTVARNDESFTPIYFPVSATDLSGDLTASLTFRTDYVIKNLPGLVLSLQNAAGTSVAEVIIGSDTALCFRDGEHVYNAKKNGSTVFFRSGEWYTLTLILNRTGKSLTVYVNNDRIGSVAIGDTAGFAGILLDRYVTTGAKDGKFSFDRLTVAAGMLAPGNDTPLDANDPLVTVDTRYTEPNGGDSGTTGGKDPSGEGTSDKPKDNSNDGKTTTETPSDNDKKDGCASSIGGTLALIGLTGVAGAMVHTRRIKED